MWKIEADGSLLLLRDQQTMLRLRPFISSYGVKSFAHSVQQLHDQRWEYHTAEGIAFWCDIQTIAEHTESCLMFHVKPPVPHIGIEWTLDPGGPWYGMGERVIQSWPLEQAGAHAAPFQSVDHGLDGNLNIVTPLWLGAAGIALLVEEDTGRLDISIDADPQGRATLLQHAPPTAFGTGIDGPAAMSSACLKLRVFCAPALPEATQLALRVLGLPQATPPLEMCAAPIWTTWAQYKMHIDQQQTLQFAQQIIEHQFPHSVLEIDDRWQLAYGELCFDPVKFPDPKAMVDQLHQQGFKVTLWIPPFFDPDSAAFKYAAAQGYLVQHPRLDQPYLTRWWQGWGGLLDVTNAQALNWWQQGLQQLQTTYGIDGFKFDGGEANFLPPEARTAEPIMPHEYTDRYVHWIAQHWSWTEVRAGWRSQGLPILFREWDKWSRWGRDNGLHAVITQALTLGIIGYPFVLPDMIGGNAYNAELPDRELLIRWTQVSALMPAMQFSIPPWIYDEETVAICRQYAVLHTQLVPDLQRALSEVLASGTPIVRPLWWHAPSEPATYTIDDQWFFGERWLVAPVIHPQTSTRSIYLPEGTWRDQQNTVYTGPTRLEAYAAPLDTLPLFERL